MQIASLFHRSALATGVRDHPHWAAGLGVGLVVAGLLALLSPMVLGVAAMVTVGLLLIIGGVGHCAWAMQTGSKEHGWLIFGLGVIAIIAGCYLVFLPITALTTVIAIVAAYLTLTGAGTAAQALALQSLDGWLWMLGSGALAVLLAILVVAQWPLSGVWAVGMLIGVQLISGGIALVRMVLTRDFARKIAELDG